jgi:flagellar biosynthetic protein FlhB
MGGSQLMSYDRQEATEQPTPTRLKRAREEGQVARSSDLSSSMLSLAAIGFALYWFPNMIAAVELLLSQGVSFSTEDPRLLLWESGKALLPILWLPCLVLFVAAVFSGVIQVGGLFAPVAAKMDVQRIDPVSGWTRLWGGHGWMNLVFSCCKLTIAVIAAVAVGWTYKNELLSISNVELVAGFSTIAMIAGKIVFASAGSLFVLGLLDVAWQRYLWKTNLKMTRQEVVIERKEQNGNAHIRRTVPLSKHATERVVPSLVIVGKTIAISIRWNPTTMTSPVVLAFIREDEIDTLVEKAKLQNIPVDINHWLCKRIEQSCDVGTMVPPSLHSEIALVLTIGRRKIA